MTGIAGQEAGQRGSGLEPGLSDPRILGRAAQLPPRRPSRTVSPRRRAHLLCPGGQEAQQGTWSAVTPPTSTEPELLQEYTRLVHSKHYKAVRGVIIIPLRAAHHETQVPSLLPFKCAHAPCPLPDTLLSLSPLGRVSFYCSPNLSLDLPRFQGASMDSSHSGESISGLLSCLCGPYPNTWHAGL